METLIFLITNKEDGLASITYFCNEVKDREDANHQLGFTRRLMGTYTIFNSLNVDKATKEIIFCPSGRIGDIKKGKNIIDVKNCMWFVGEYDSAKNRIKSIIDWMLNMGDILS